MIKDANEVTIIRTRTYYWLPDFTELWQYRELFYAFVVRDLKLRYKQTLIGGAWAIVQPFLTMIIFSFFFGKIAKIPSDGLPYPVFSYAGLVLWTYFSNAVSNSSLSLISNSNLISKVYFPRMIIPLASTLTGLIDYAIALSILIAMMIWFKLPLTFTVLWLPLILLITWILASGIGLGLAALNVKYRDIRYALPFFIQLLIFLSPVIYPYSVSGNYQWLVTLNPMTGILESHRNIIIGHQPVPFYLLFSSIGMSIVIFSLGVMYFKQTERYFADII